jgi:hypothetical protein
MVSKKGITMHKLTTTELQVFIARNISNAAALVKLDMMPAAKRLADLITEAERELEVRILGGAK